MVERNYEAPAGWMDWEKKYHLAYASHGLAVAEVLDWHKAECGCGNNGAGGLEPTHCSFSGR
ncbi:hypothetical protein EJ110_NYTH45563 [Nymphaea thermarum]|nr:hypothetical protein EJ110_NYTH45563 [Nymphaea thermarum]